ncbi:zinc-binding dehydrogenase [Paenibacillus sp. N1-5-1-14]|uniref:quinone oxidoreductase family protein n=1 Tax=Paenibacillus radicibacter TaxID=2972488 RepID=UPI002158B8A4|nr:zinc-binding dehydrogenase [Paenibacillus radicibacter]MCR8642654.1 zinc-binding dehydrogenase [Paenibacillus radicibacter]
MKAVIVEQFGSADNMKVVDQEIPTPNPDQVLIRVKTTSVNFADIKARHGNKGGGKLPFLPGLEAAGVIEQVGRNVVNLAVGDRVIAFPHDGSYAEYIVADANLTYVLPDQIDWDTAGACGIVSFLSYKLLAGLSHLQKGDSVLIHAAAGGVGTTAIQIARALGAGLIIGTVGHPNKIQTALDAGADKVIVYEQDDFAAKVNELTAGRGVDIILDSVGGVITESSMNCLAKYGRLVVFGNSSGKYGNVNTKDLHASCRSVLGFSLGTTRKERPDILQEIAVQVFELLSKGKLNIQIGAKFPFQDAAQAHQFVESRQSTGKVVLTFDL